jgi:titin
MPVTVVRLAPLAVDDFYRTRPNVIFESSPLSVLDNDNDQQSDPLTAMLGDEPDNGDVILNLDGTFVYTPTLDFAGEDTFTYHASDGVLDSNVATVTIAVGAHRVYLPMVIRQYP